MTGPAVESSGSLEDFVGSAFGEFSEGSEPGREETPEVAASEPSPEHPASPEEAPAPEGTDKAERTGEPPKTAASEAPDKATPDDDPLKSATPFTYVVNGETKTYDGIKVLGTDGAIIDADKLEDLQRRLGERDHLYEANSTLWNTQRQLERLSEWKVRGEDGQERVLQGREGLEAMRVENAQKEASLNALASIFQRDQQGNFPNFAKLVTVVQGPVGQDGQPTLVIVPDQEFLNNLIASADQAEKIAAFETREALGKLAQAPAASTSQAQDFSSQALPMIEIAAKAAGIDSKVLTEKDRGFLASQFPRYVRASTIADERANPTDPRFKVGSPIVDASFTQVVKDRVEMRTEASRSVISATQATKENEARLAAAARTTKTPQTTTTQRKRPEPSERQTDADKGFDLIDNLMSRKAG